MGFDIKEVFMGIGDNHLHSQSKQLNHFSQKHHAGHQHDVSMVTCYVTTVTVTLYTLVSTLIVVLSALKSALSLVRSKFQFSILFPIHF